MSATREFRHSEASEIIVAGSVIQEEGARKCVREILPGPEAILTLGPRIAVAGCFSMEDRGEPIDLAGLHQELLRACPADYKRVGGPSYLAGLVDQVTTTVNVAHHAGVVRRDWEARRLEDEAHRLIERVKRNGNSPGDVLVDFWEAVRDVQGTAKGDPRQAVVVCLKDVAPRKVSWLWPGRIARGKINLNVGDPGTGKSFHAGDVTARTTTGRPWPDGAPGVCGAAVWLTAEDGLADTMRPRMDDLGADVSRVHFITGVGDPARPSSFNLASDLMTLEDVILQTGAVLAVVDPLGAYLGDVDSHKDADVRGILAPLAAMAERTDVAVLGIMHLNKSQQQRALYRATGALAFVAAARAVFAVTEDQEDPGRRLYVPLKMNLAPKPPTLAFRLDGGRLTWEEGTVMVDAEAALGGWEAKAERSERDEAKDFLREVLAEGPVSAKAIKRQAEAAGISERTLKRGKSDLGIMARKRSFGGEDAWIWELPSKEASGCPLGTPGPLRPSSCQLAPFEEGHASQEGHEEGQPTRDLAPLALPLTQQQLTSSSYMKNTKGATGE